MGRVALIAGRGDIVNLAIELLEDPLVISLVDNPEYPHHYRFSPGEVGRILKTLKREGVDRVAFFGKVEKRGIFGGYKLDLTAVRLLVSLRSFRDDEIMDKVVEVLGKEGIEVIDQKELFAPLIPQPGVICGSLDEREKGDVAFGYRVAKEMGRFQVGQTVVVKKGVVLAVEAVEGTDETIKRAGNYARDFVVVKVRRPTQSSYMDLPVVGDRTIFVAKEAGASTVAVEAGETIVTYDAVEMAENLKVNLVAVDETLVEEWDEGGIS